MDPNRLSLLERPCSLRRRPPCPESPPSWFTANSSPRQTPRAISVGAAEGRPASVSRGPVYRHTYSLVQQQTIREEGVPGAKPRPFRSYSALFKRWESLAYFNPTAHRMIDLPMPYKLITNASTDPTLRGDGVLTPPSGNQRCGPDWSTTMAPSPAAPNSHKSETIVFMPKSLFP